MEYIEGVGVDELDESQKGQSSDISSSKLDMETLHDKTLMSNWLL
jgi:hypothetical protein